MAVSKPIKGVTTMPFYSRCPKCGYARRFLTEEESKDKDLVAKNKKTPLTQEELIKAKQVKDVHCLKCKPNTTKAKKTKKKEDEE
jgi:hypothetical protein